MTARCEMLSGDGQCLRDVHPDWMPHRWPGVVYRPPTHGKHEREGYRGPLPTLPEITTNPELATRIERVYGSPPRYGELEREIGRARHSEARRRGGMAPWEHNTAGVAFPDSTSWQWSNSPTEHPE